MIFTGTIRFQLDPFSQYSDINVWDALEQVSSVMWIAPELSSAR